MDVTENTRNIDSIPDSVLSYILSLVYDYKYKDNTHIRYLLVSKKFNKLINDLKCKICKKGVYILNIPRPSICSTCGHNLETEDIVTRRAELYNFRKKKY